MKIIFAGTPEFAASALAALLVSRHQVVLVLTQPDRPAGRGMKDLASPVKQLAQAGAIPVMQPISLRDPEIQEALKAVSADVMVVAAYGLILPQSVLDIPCLGAVNIHASLLPRWRGAAPIQRAILAGDSETGVCIMRMDAGLDTGPVLLSESIPISVNDTTQTLHDGLAAMGAKLILSALEGLENSSLAPRAQPSEGATYARKIEKSEAKLKWTDSAVTIDRQIRAFSPFPGAHSTLHATSLKLWRASPVSKVAPGNARPGEILSVESDRLLVACGEGVLGVTELQRPGGRKLRIAEFARGFAFAPGDCFGL